MSEQNLSPKRKWVVFVRFSLIIGLCFSGLLSGCDKNLESSSFNVYFYYPDNREEFLGQVTGLTACGSLAHSKAGSLNVSSANWGYVCCLKTNSSVCAEKYR